jgi:hypothetical protein
VGNRKKAAVDGEDFAVPSTESNRDMARQLLSRGSVDAMPSTGGELFDPVFGGRRTLSRK